MCFNDLLARLKYKITFLAKIGKTEKNDPESTSGNGEQPQGDKSDSLSSEPREEVFAVADSSTAFSPRVRLSDLYSKRISSGEFYHSFIWLQVRFSQIEIEITSQTHNRKFEILEISLCTVII